MSGRKLTLAGVLRQAQTQALSGLHTALPGQIEEYDWTTQRAKVKPLIQRQDADGTLDSFPVIVDVPVIWPRAGGASLTFPVQAGDYVLLIFAERSLDWWLTQGGESPPGDVRRFDLSDAIAIPGLYPFNEPSLDPNGQDVRLQMGAANIVINPGGKIAIGTEAVSIELPPPIGLVTIPIELLDLIDQTLTALSTAFAGTYPLSCQAQMAVLQVKINAIKGDL